ncbi:MAG TPA: FAD-dependent oxidoreductase [Candidatus Limnocylindria bacterium]|nr:FAD-dependent oxidoreductase [Candidatus Limnocylindria bacterium]
MEREIDVLLVGAGVASARCARTLRRNGFDGSILLVGDEPMPPYNRPPLSKELLREDLPPELLMAEPASFYERRAVEVRTGVTVTSLDAETRRATLEDGSTLRYGRCLLATGAEPLRLPVPGGDLGLPLRTVADAQRLRARAQDADPGTTVAIVGGGLIGVEVASGLAALGLRPTILERAGALWAGSLGHELAAWAAARLADAGVVTRTDASVTGIEPGAVLVGEERMEARFSVVGIGVRPRVAMAAAAGLVVDDGIVVDAEQRTSDERIWAAGDVARTAGRRVEHWHAAREAGERAALSMLGRPVPPLPVPWTFTEVAGTPVDILGTPDDWDEERWIGGGRVLAYRSGAHVVQLAVIDAALDPGRARALVAAPASVAEVEREFTANS